MVVKWTFFDPTNSDTAEFEINPNAGGSPSQAKNITVESTVAPGGNILFFEGSSQPQDFTFSGTLLTDTQLFMFQLWFQKKHPIELTDDLGRTYTIYIKDFSVQRVRAARHPYKHTYTVTAIQV